MYDRKIGQEWEFDLPAALFFVSFVYFVVCYLTFRLSLLPEAFFC